MHKGPGRCPLAVCSPGKRHSHTQAEEEGRKTGVSWREDFRIRQYCE